MKKKYYTCMVLLVASPLCFINCSGEDNPTSPPDTPEVATEFNAKDTLVVAYKQNFELDIREPAFFHNGPYWTSTAYLDSSLYRLYLYRDGTVDALKIPHKKPKGTYRVVVVAIDYENTNISNLLNNLWMDVQQEINQQHIAFAESKGYTEPILQFLNTNILASKSEIAEPKSRNDIIAFVESKGYKKEDFDIFVSLNLDAQHIAGGFAGYGGDFIHMGYYFAATDFADLTELTGLVRKPMLFWIAKSVYDHEAGHIFGWEHEWTPFWDVNQPTSFITRPVLFGWIDVDGDGIPEILDASPYGYNNDSR